VKNDALYLRSNVQVEPLVDSWYAWSHLIPPATLARNITERHIKIMESYIKAPNVHADAVRNPKMLGGPFIDYGGERVSEIQDLLDKTRTQRTPLLGLSAAIRDLDRLLESAAKGFSVESLYQQVPPCLRGYVELIYDLNNHPSFRLVESLLYKSKFYQPEAQSLALSLINDDDRPFVLSTPRLPSPNVVLLQLPFNDPRVDWLFKLKRSPKAWEEITAALEIADQDRDRLRMFFSPEDESAPYGSYKGAGVRWRYFGHACILVESDEVSILFDPVLSYTYESTVSRFTYADLPDHIDYVVITHNHQDHILLETLVQIKHKVGMFIVPAGGGGTLQDPSVRMIFEEIGCSNVRELSELGTIRFAEGGGILGIPFFGEHADLDIRSKLGYLVELGRHRLLFMADSRNIEPALYEHVASIVGEADAIFVGMECDGAPLSWLYGPLITKAVSRSMDSSRRLSGSDFEQAMGIVSRFRCREVYVYAMGQEPWLNYIMSIKYTDESKPIVESNKLLAECARRGIIAERLFGEKEILLS
jgi:L-ascorbate metabolism protein UlaG (beta-lactamase superfamily)